MSEISSAQVPVVGTPTPVQNPEVAAPVAGATPVVAVKKGKNPALILAALGGVVVLLGLVVVVVIVLINGNKGSQTDFKSHDTSLLGKVDNSSYTFYYPKAYAKQSVTTSDQIDEYYQSSTKNGLQGYNSINLVSSTEETAIEKQSDCTLIATSMTSLYEEQFGLEASDVTKVKSDLFKVGTMIGCDMQFKLNLQGMNFYVDQLVYTKTGQKSTYVVTLSHDKATGSEYDELRASAESFLIK